MKSVLDKLQLGDDKAAIAVTAVASEFNLDPCECLTRCPREHTVCRAVQ
jgi:hypothetical protein